MRHNIPIKAENGEGLWLLVPTVGGIASFILLLVGFIPPMIPTCAIIGLITTAITLISIFLMCTHAEFGMDYHERAAWQKYRELLPSTRKELRLKPKDLMDKFNHEEAYLIRADIHKLAEAQTERVKAERRAAGQSDSIARLKDALAKEEDELEHHRAVQKELKARGW